MLGIIGNKVGMSQIFTENGDAIPVTIIKAGPCFITQIKTLETHGYNSIQIGYHELAKKKLNKPEIGHFKNAVTPDVDTFRDSLDIIEADLKNHKEDKNLVMYCTGGIRCEKASAYFKHKGFKNVFQLEGGIIEYTRQVKEKNLENKFLGQNFVFDDRRAERISEDVVAHCHQCGQPFDVHTNCANEACHLLFIQCDTCKEKMENCCSTACMEINRLPYEEQKELRKGKGNSNDIFKKGRADHLPFKKDLRNIFETLKINKE